MALIGFTCRNAMVQVKKKSYVLVAREKGFSEGYVFLHYILKNSANPILNMMVICFATNTVGSFYVESVYSIQGMGKLMVSALTSLDYGLIMGLTVFYGFLFIMAIFIIDILSAAIDPRLRAAAAGGIPQ